MLYFIEHEKSIYMHRCSPHQMPRLKSVWASSSRFQWLFPIGNDSQCLSYCCEARLLDDNDNEPNPRWNAGRFAPVTLKVELDESAATVEICPEMVPEQGRG